MHAAVLGDDEDDQGVAEDGQQADGAIQEGQEADQAGGDVKRVLGGREVPLGDLSLLKSLCGHPRCDVAAVPARPTVVVVGLGVVVGGRSAVEPGVAVVREYDEVLFEGGCHDFWACCCRCNWWRFCRWRWWGWFVLWMQLLLFYGWFVFRVKCERGGGGERKRRREREREREGGSGS